MPQKSVELDPGTRSTTSTSRARANSLAMPGPLGDAGVARHVRTQLLERVVLRRPPAIEARPVHGARHDPALLADLEDHPQLVGHAEQPSRVLCRDTSKFGRPDWHARQPPRA